MLEALCDHVLQVAQPTTLHDGEVLDVEATAHRAAHGQWAAGLDEIDDLLIIDLEVRGAHRILYARTSRHRQVQEVCRTLREASGGGRRLSTARHLRGRGSDSANRRS